MLAEALVCPSLYKTMSSVPYSRGSGSFSLHIHMFSDTDPSCPLGHEPLLVEPLEVLFPSSRHPHLQGANSPLKCTGLRSLLYLRCTSCPLLRCPRSRDSSSLLDTSPNLLTSSSRCPLSPRTWSLLETTFVLEVLILSKPLKVLISSSRHTFPLRSRLLSYAATQRGGE